MANSNVQLKLKNVRISFWHGYNPQERRDDKTNELTGYNFNCSVLVTKNHPQFNEIKDAMKKSKALQWGDSGPRIPAERLCFRNGEPLDPDTNEPKALYDGYAGCWYLSVNRTVTIEEYEKIKAGKKKRPVKIIGPKKNEEGKFPETNEDDQFAIYSGCYANVVISIYAYIGDTKKNQPPRINASLEAVQFKGHGERFGNAGVDVEKAFDEEEIEDEMEEETSSSSKTKAKTAEDDDGI